MVWAMFLVQLLLAVAALWYAMETRLVRQQNQEQLDLLREQVAAQQAVVENQQARAALDRAHQIDEYLELEGWETVREADGYMPIDADSAEPSEVMEWAEETDPKMREVSRDLRLLAPGLPDDLAMPCWTAAVSAMGSANHVQRLYHALRFASVKAQRDGQELTWERAKAAYYTDVRKETDAPEWEQLLEGDYLDTATEKVDALQEAAVDFLIRRGEAPEEAADD